MRKQLTILGLLALLIGGGSVGALVARADKASELEEAPTPPPPPTPRISSSGEFWLSISKYMKPYRPPPPMQLTVPRAEARDEILEEVKRICRLLKPGKVTPAQVAHRLGAAILQEDPNGIDFRPRNPYFSWGTLGSHSEYEDESNPVVYYVALTLTDPRLLLETEAVKALGPDRGIIQNRIDSWDPTPIHLAWAGQPRQGMECEIIINPEWGHHYYGMEENPVKDVHIGVFPDD